MTDRIVATATDSRSTMVTHRVLGLGFRGSRFQSLLQRDANTSGCPRGACNRGQHAHRAGNDDADMRHHQT